MDPLSHYLDCTKLHQVIVDAAPTIHLSLGLHEPLDTIRLNRWDLLVLPHFDVALTLARVILCFWHVQMCWAPSG